jgi:hypothetical protein
MTTPAILVLSGAALHTDPWHALDDTSAAIAALFAGAEVRRTDDPNLSLDGAEVVVVNVSGEPGDTSNDSARIVDLLLDHVAAGRGVVAVHSSSIAFADDERWAALLGGRWVAEVSGHPPIGEAKVLSRSTLTEDFVAYDERYSDLETSPGIEIVAVHEEDGVVHPLAWLNPGAGRVAYSALGHGTESYDSPNAAFLRALVDWARGA